MPEKTILAMHKTDNPCRLGWNCGSPATFTADALREIRDAIRPPDNSSRILAAAYTYSYARYPIADVAESIRNTIRAAREIQMPVIFHLDGVNWWNAHPELWNWFDPAMSGYDPANIRNVERYDWQEDTAVQIAWRNWGSQIRVLPPPNLASPAFLQLQYDCLDVLLPLMKDFAETDPDLFGGLVFGWELSPYVQAYYYKNGNTFRTASTAEDPQDGASESIALGYAAAATLDLQNEGVITEQTIDGICTWYLDRLIEHACIHGIPRERIITHAYWGGETKRGGGHSGTASVRPGVLPGWSFYGGNIHEMDRQLAMAPDGWALIECRPWDLTLSFLRSVYETGCRIVNIFNWESIREDTKTLQALQTILQ